MVEDELVNVSESKSQLGKIGVVLMAIGMIILYVDGARLYLTVTVGYQFYEHPEIHIPIIGFIVAFLGMSIFIYNFRKGRNVI
jgi:hypothetical protein